jgi:hypothetical protein
MAAALKGNGITGRVFQVQTVAIRAPEIYIWCLSGVVAGNLKLTNVWSYGNIRNQVTDRSSSDHRAIIKRFRKRILLAAAQTTK